MIELHYLVLLLVFLPAGPRPDWGLSRAEGGGLDC